MVWTALYCATKGRPDLMFLLPIIGFLLAIVVNAILVCTMCGFVCLAVASFSRPGVPERDEQDWWEL